jgi:hypothetical protein
MASRGGADGGAGRIVEAGDPAWDDTLARVPHDVYHLPGYARVEAEVQQATPVAFLHTGERHRFLLPLLLRPVPGSTGVEALSPYGYPGPVSDSPLDDETFWREAVQSLRDCLSAARVVTCFVRLHPLLPGRLDALARAGTVVQHGHTVSIDLTVPGDVLWARTRSNHRRNIEQARRSGLQVVVDDWSRLPEFVEAYHETMRRVRATEQYFFPPAYFESLRKHVPGSVHLAVVDDSGTLAGGGIFLEQDGIVQYHLGATRSVYLPRQPTKLMFDEVRRWAATRGDRALHLGGGVGGRVNPLFHFKAGFSDDRPPFFTWRVVPDPDAYAAALKTVGRELPADDSGWFPAYRRPGAAA